MNLIARIAEVTMLAGGAAIILGGGLLAWALDLEGAARSCSLPPCPPP
ncbi:MAG: hypothetical protein KIT86_14220 [Hydrogenophaga sp.]|jgi:hypothetical protein|nr:hypothetical protein [Hydrogenophaga sp.]MCW5670809.1 hypothetical protein [Hydrogenophaga sp.]